MPVFDIHIHTRLFSDCSFISPDDLIEQDVRDRADKRQVALVLPDDFVTGGKGDEGFLGSSKGNGAAIGH